jgi:hypothetical protein
MVNDLKYELHNVLSGKSQIRIGTISEGAEQKVYLKDSEHVLKLNDAIYYNSWKDYLYNLLQTKLKKK